MRRFAIIVGFASVLRTRSDLIGHVCTRPTMNRALGLSLLFLVLVPVTWAQETPQYEVFAGASYAREELTQIKFINGVGWHASVSGNANTWLGAVFDFSGHYSSPKVGLSLSVPIPIKASTYSYLFGPRFSYREWERLTPYVEGLVGAENFRFTAESVGLTNAASSTMFAGAFGGGVDVPINKRFAIRLIQADYVLTRFRKLSVNPITGEPEFTGPRRTQNNLRASVGFVLRFGSR